MIHDLMMLSLALRLPLVRPRSADAGSDERSAVVWLSVALVEVTSSAERILEWRRLVVVLLVLLLMMIMSDSVALRVVGCKEFRLYQVLGNVEPTIRA